MSVEEAEVRLKDAQRELSAIEVVRQAAIERVRVAREELYFAHLNKIIKEEYGG